MANKVLDLLLQLTVKGTDQAVALENAIEAIAEEMKGLKGSKSLDDILGIVGTDVRVKQLTASVRALFEAGRLGFDLDLSKPFIKAGESVDSVRAKIKAVAEDAKRLFELKEADQAAAQTAKWTAELARLQEKAAGVALALEREAEALKQAQLAKAAAETARLTAEMEKLREQAAGVAQKITAIRTAQLERLKEAAAGAIPPLTALEKEIAKLQEAFRAGRDIKFDIDVSKPISDLQRLQGQLKVLSDKYLKGQQELKINTSTARKDIEAVIQSLIVTQRQLVALTRDKAKININSTDAITLREALEGVNAQLVQAKAHAAQFAATRGTFSQYSQEAQGAAKATGNLRSEVGTLTRDMLFLRRAIFGLGFSFVAKELVSVAIQFDNMRQSLSAVFGTTEKANEQFKFLETTAERLGLSITSITDRYNKLSIAGREAGLSQEVIKDNFLAVAEAGARLHLSVEQVDGALLALEQIASKGKVSMEELRRQLGNALPGAMSIAAKALGITTEKLFELVENGQLASNVFLKVFPSAIRAAFSVDTNTRIDTTQAAINRFVNAIKTMVDTVVRAGALDAFTDTLLALTKAAKDPTTVQFMKDLSAGLKSLTVAVTENIDVVKDLAKAYLLFKGVTIIIGLVTSLRAAFITLASVGAASAAATAGIAGIGAAAGTATAGVGLLTIAVRALRAVAIRAIPIVISLVGVELIKVALNNISALEEKVLDLADATRQLASDNKIIDFYRQQVKGLEEFAGAAHLTSKDIKSLAVETLPIFQKQLEGTITLTKAQVKEVDAQIKAYEDMLVLLKKQGPLTAEQIASQERAKKAIEELTQARVGLIAQETKYTTELQKVVNAQGGVFVSVEHLNGAIQSQITLFDQAIKSGKGVRESLEKAIPDSFALGGVQAITDVAITMERLAQQASVTGRIIEEELAKKLNNLNGQELSTFIRNAEKANKDLLISAEALAFVINGAVRAALKNLGEDVETVGTGVSKSFLEMAQSFKALAEAGTLTGEQLAGALNKVTESAKTAAEISFLKAVITVTGIEAKNMGAAITDALQKLGDKAREVAGIVDTSLADSFRRLSLQTIQQVSANLAQLIIDFKRVAGSGELAGTSIADAFLKVRDAVLAAGGSNAQLIESALLAKQKIQDAFNEGRIGVAQYVEELGKARIATANVFSDPLNLAGLAFKQFGIKTRAELIAIAQAAQDAFNLISASGQFTAADLQKSAEDVRKKWVDAFGAIEVAATQAFEAVSAFSGFRRDFQAFDTDALKLTNTDDLKKMIEDLEGQLVFQTRKGSNPDPLFLKTLMAALQQLINELNRRGEKTGLPSRNVPIGPDGNFNVNFNFAGVPDEKWIRSFLLPTLDKFAKRTA